MSNIDYYIRELYRDEATLSDLVQILQELVSRIEALEKKLEEKNDH